MLRLAFDFIITWRETRTRPNAYQKFTLLWVLQNLIFWKNTARVLMRVSLASFIQSFRLNVWQKPQACRTGAWDAGTDSVLPQRSPLWS